MYSHSVATPAGSSPLTRGKRRDHPRRPRRRRLIPAHAGKTRSQSLLAVGRSAHPRSRGENIRESKGRSIIAGSSPLTRGKLPSRLAPPYLVRLIPAHAGKTISCSFSFAFASAHPRSRGENVLRRASMSVIAGSSPLTRGKHGRVVAVVGSHRLIPTHAGKTGFRSCVRSSRPTHPRSCGENALEDLAYMPAPGSSPLMRGKLFGGLVRRGLHGLIPAHAGKTGRGSQRTRATRAHPHSRGENYRLTIDRGAYTGSSPLMRGKPSLRRPRRGQNGLIPTHAGKTPNLSWRKSRSWAHPRSRGENVTCDSMFVGMRGSSPLTRGKHAAPHSTREQIGLIPAHAGKTSYGHQSGRAWPAHPRSRGENPSGDSRS